LITGVGVEKVQFPPKQPKIGGTKMPRKSRTSFVGILTQSFFDPFSGNEFFNSHRRLHSLTLGNEGFECNRDFSTINSLEQCPRDQIGFLSMQLAKHCVAAIIVVLLSSTACNRKQAYEWHTLEARDKTFSLSLPGDAVQVDTPAKSVTGGSFISHSFKVRASNDAAYGCSWWEDSSRPIDRTAEQILDTARDGGLSAADAKLISESRLTLQGHPARDIRGIARGVAAYDNRVVVVGNRLYTLLVVDASGKHDSKSIEKFFNSLQFH
jgi:hypothetical protein